MITIRKPQKNEWKALQKLNDEVFVDNHTYDPDLKLDWARSDAGKTYFQQIVSSSKPRCFVAEYNNQLIGYIAFSPKSFDYRKSRYIEIDNMGVSPAFRSNGIGKKLIQQVTTWAKENNYQKLYVNAYSDNTKAIDFYQNNGFTEIDISLEKSL